MASTTTTTTTSPPSRIVIEAITPRSAGGRPVKRVTGEPVTVGATIYAEGHDRLWCVVASQVPGQRASVLIPMAASEPGLDRWTGQILPTSVGRHRFRVLAWIDRFGSWCDATTRKIDAGLDISSELLEGAAILDAAAVKATARARSDLLDAAGLLRAGDTTPLTDRGGEERPSALDRYHESLAISGAASSTSHDVLVERERAQFSAWYELFPRSWSEPPGRHGTLADVEAHLGYVADMGFDVLYLPPIHPIGRSFRKGPDNTAEAGPDDVGSPWAIGSADGGHTAVHPALGTLEDFDSLVRVAGENGIEIALDIALQCSPDHPWVTEHPDWFRHRPDGTIQYAENPPKKYQDIYPLDFESPDWRGLWEGCRDIFLFWAERGVRIFRVDNPHTKPFPFWEWLIEEVRTVEPDAIFLAEAFSRPAIMRRLAVIGFTQSYTYFTWRVDKGEITDYFTELSSPPSVDHLRPSCWPNTPDILPAHLMGAPLTMFATRVFLAALLSPSYGIYGPSFELGDNTPADNGKEEYGRSEKYEIRAWDRSSPDSLRDLVRNLNQIRTEHHALHTLRTLRFHPIDNDALVCFSKTDHSGPVTDPHDPHRCVILVIANLDPHHEQRGTTWLDLEALGIDAARPYQVHDLLTDQTFSWYGASNYVELHPDRVPGHVLRISQEAEGRA